MRKLIIPLVAVMVMGSILTGYALSGSQSEPSVAEPVAGAEVLVADENGDLLKCNGKLAKVKAGGAPSVAAPFGGQSPTMMDRSKKLHRYGCEKDKNGKETGAVMTVEVP